MQPWSRIIIFYIYTYNTGNYNIYSIPTFIYIMIESVISVVISSGDSANTNKDGQTTRE